MKKLKLQKYRIILFYHNNYLHKWLVHFLICLLLNLLSPLMGWPTHCVKSVQIQSFFWSIFFCIRPEYRKIRTKKISVFGHFPCSDLDWHFMEVGQHAYLAGWGWWMHAGSVPCNQKLSCKWNLSFFQAAPPNKLPFYLNSLPHIISSLFRQFCLFQNAILHKMLKVGFWNLKPIFLRMQFSLVATFFLYFWLSVWVEIYILNFLMGF